MKDLNYYKNNAEEDYLGVPISVLRYIDKLEKQQERSYSEEEVLKLLISKEENTKDSTKYNGVEYITPEEWFEQFKKK